MGKEITVSRVRNIGHFDRDEHVIYDLEKRVANVSLEGGDKAYEEYTDKERFEEDIKVVIRLAKKEIPKLEEKIQNNKRVIALSEGNQLELEKANRHLSNNQRKLEFISKFIEGNGQI
jgi:hypothetical protein